MRGVLTAMLLAALADIAPAIAADNACPGAAQGFQGVKEGDLEFAVRWDPAELKVGQFFAAEVVYCGTYKWWPDDRIKIDAVMPAHGHGMNYRPTAERIAAGHYRFTGLMLHMPGTWRFRFSHMRGDVGFMLEHDVDLRQ